MNSILSKLYKSKDSKQQTQAHAPATQYVAQPSIDAFGNKILRSAPFSDTEKPRLNLGALDLV